MLRRALTSFITGIMSVNQSKIQTSKCTLTHMRSLGNTRTVQIGVLLPWWLISPVYQRQYVQHGGYVWVGVAWGLLQVFQSLLRHWNEAFNGYYGWHFLIRCMSPFIRSRWADGAQLEVDTPPTCLQSGTATSYRPCDAYWITRLWSVRRRAGIS